MIPHPKQNAIDKLDTLEFFERGLVTLSITNSRLNVRIASIHVPWTGDSAGFIINVGSVVRSSTGFKLKQTM